MDTNKRLIELKGVTKSYSSLKVLENISLHLSPGEIVSILGPSGCGKTTILNIIAGLTFQDEGEVKVAKNKRIGYVFQAPRLIPWKNIENNILFVQKNYPLEKNTARKIRKELIHMTGMEEFIHCFPCQLSGGMKQRVSLIRALSILPHILLLDEPFKSIDEETISIIEEIILQIWKKTRQGILMVTHNQEKAFKLSNRVYILSPRPAKIIKEVEIPLSESTELFLSQFDYSMYSSNKESEKRLGPGIKKFISGEVR